MTFNVSTRKTRHCKLGCMNLCLPTDTAEPAGWRDRRPEYDMTNKPTLVLQRAQSVHWVCVYSVQQVCVMCHGNEPGISPWKIPGAHRYISESGRLLKCESIYFVALAVKICTHEATGATQNRLIIIWTRLLEPGWPLELGGCREAGRRPPKSQDIASNASCKPK